MGTLRRRARRGFIALGAVVLAGLGVAVGWQVVDHYRTHYGHEVAVP